jgi:hypothetical protein
MQEEAERHTKRNATTIFKCGRADEAEAVFLVVCDPSMYEL